MALRLMSEVGLDGSGFSTGLNKLESSAHSALSGLKGFFIGAIGVGTVEQAISRTVETAKELVDTSKRLAIAPEQLQVLRQAAKQSGVELEDVAHAFEKIDEARQKAMLPGQEGQQFMGAFKELGIGSEQLHGMTASQLFMGPMRNAVQNRNPEELGALFRELGIKGFGPMITVLKTNFDELGKHMKDMGAIMSSETAVKLKAVSDEFELLSRIVISQLGPALIKLAEFIYSSVLKAGKATAGAAAFYGAGTAGQGPLHALGTMLKTAGLGAEHFVGAISTEELKKRMTGMGFNLPGAQTAAAAAQAPWKARQAEFEAMLADFKRQANDLKNPKPADFSGSSLPTKMSMKALGGPSDSLVNVGNFLGGMGITARIEERKLQLLGEIARNTREKRNPDTIARMQSSIDHYRSFIGLQTIFPHH